MKKTTKSKDDFNFEERDEEIIAGEQETIREKRIAQLKPYQYKKGQSGNPSGRPKGISLKEYARLKFLHMNEDEREEFFNGLSKDVIWEMGEGKPKQDLNANMTGDITVTLVKYHK